MSIINCKMCGKAFEYSGEGLAICSSCELSLKPTNPTENNEQGSVAKFEQAALKAIAEGDFFMAKNVVNNIFNKEPENYIAHYCNLLCQYSLRGISDFNPEYDWENDQYFKRAYRYAQGEIKQMLDDFLQNQEKETLYMKLKKDPRKFLKDKNQDLSILRGYKDADEFIEKKAAYDAYEEEIYSEGYISDYFIKKFKEQDIDAVYEIVKAQKKYHRIPTITFKWIAMILAIAVAIWGYKIYNDFEGYYMVCAFGALIGAYIASTLDYSFDNKLAAGTYLSSIFLGFLIFLVVFFSIESIVDEAKAQLVSLIIALIPLPFEIVKFIFLRAKLKLQKRIEYLNDEYLQAAYEKIVEELLEKYSPHLNEADMDTIYDQKFHWQLHSDIYSKVHNRR